MKRKIISLILCFSIIVGLIPSLSLAASNDFEAEQKLAEDLRSLGLFKGVSDTDFALDRAPTRTEALVMLIRVLGKESEALSQGGKHPFLDVPDWADKYVGYAYQRNLTNGISATKFGSGTDASSSMYLTFVLRALGYSDKNGADFTWDDPFTLARTTGIMIGNPDTINFLRADVVLISYAALEAEVKESGQTLAQKLILAGAISAAAYDKYYDVSAFEHSAEDPTRKLSSEEIYEKCSPAVFYIEVYDEQGEPFAFGSGFFISSDGTAVTNYHVIDGAYSAKIMTADKKQHKVLGVYDFNKARDWAIIKVDGKNFSYLEIDESKINGGEEIFTIGSPKGLNNTISEGLISNPNRNLDGTPFIQISAPISPGSSGGALLNKYGKVIGITSGGFENDAQNLNLAIPITLIKGYKDTTVHSFAAITPSENDKILGNVNLDQYPKEKRAFELLKMWIYNNMVENASWGPVYIETSKDENEITDMCIGYDEAYDDFILALNSRSETAEITCSLTFGTGEKTKIVYNCEVDIDGIPFSIIGYGAPYKDEYNDQFYIFFEKYAGDDEYNLDYKTICHDNASDTVLYLLGTLDYLFTKKLSAYKIDGISDLGFKNLYFE